MFFPHCIVPVICSFLCTSSSSSDGPCRIGLLYDSDSVESWKPNKKCAKGKSEVMSVFCFFSLASSLASRSSRAVTDVPTEIRAKMQKVRQREFYVDSVLGEPRREVAHAPARSQVPSPTKKQEARHQNKEARS